MRYTALQRIRKYGVPESTVSAFLIVLGAVTFFPYIAGRQFGPYSVPELLAPPIFWLLVLIVPLLWVALLTPAHVQQFTDWKLLLRNCLGVLIVALPMSLTSAPVTQRDVFIAKLAPGEISQTFSVKLPSTQRLELAVTKIRPNIMGIGIHMTLCSFSDKENCSHSQLGEGDSFFRVAQPGKATIKLFNFATNPVVEIKLEITYVRQGLL